ncbi:nucleotide exchange factor GrpE [Streptomyces sp. NPDC051310]|uniref:nucleotide exchange factor GrpE n=1 Tax=Streptomyces sp. NPDC051310 TaxID=3365649 RepID=UPI003794D3C1
MSRLTDVSSGPGTPLMLTGPGPARAPAPAERPARRERPPRAVGPAPVQDPALQATLRERTADLQRLKAEYDNYRKRVRRDRAAVHGIAVANVLARFLPVLDALDAAADQGEVTGGFQQVARALETELSALGLLPVGAVGDPFDPLVHEAVAYHPCHWFDRPTCTVVLRPGYAVGEHLLRPATVVVAGPPPGERTATASGPVP